MKKLLIKIKNFYQDIIAMFVSEYLIEYPEIRNYKTPITMGDQLENEMKEYFDKK